MEKIAEFVARRMDEDGITSLEYGTMTWRTYEVEWCYLTGHTPMFPNKGYQRIARALKKSDLFKVTTYIPYSRSNNSTMWMPIYDLADFVGGFDNRVFEKTEV